MRVPALFWRALHARPLARPRRDAAGEAFDRRFGVDTCGIVPITHLGVVDPNWVHGQDYQAVGPSEFADALSSLNVACPDTVFIDLGAGKGRALMLAASRPFKQVIGVEISDELAAVAEKNLRIFETANPGATVTQVIRADAAAYRFPSEPLVVYLYNPFSVPVMQQVIANLNASVTARPRRVTVIYVRPELAEMWLLAPAFSLTVSHPRHQIYTTESRN